MNFNILYYICLVYIITKINFRKLEIWLDDLLDLTENILTFMIGPAFTVTCPVSNAEMESASSPGDNDIGYLEDEIERLRQQMESIKSKRVKLV